MPHCPKSVDLVAARLVVPRALLVYTHSIPVELASLFQNLDANDQPFAKTLGELYAESFCIFASVFCTSLEATSNLFLEVDFLMACQSWL